MQECVLKLLWSNNRSKYDNSFIVWCSSIVYSYSSRVYSFVIFCVFPKWCFYLGSSRHNNTDSASVKPSSPSPPPLQLWVQDVLHFSVSPAVTQGSGPLWPLWPSCSCCWSGATRGRAPSAAAAAFGKTWAGKGVAERSAGDEGGGGEARYWKWQLSKDVTLRGEPASRNPPPPPPTASLLRLRTLSHVLDTCGRQSKCGAASLSSWVRRQVRAWTQVWLLR